VFLVLGGIFVGANNNATTDNEMRSIKLPPIFQLPLYKKILARRNIVPEIREEDSSKPAPKSIFSPLSSLPNFPSGSVDSKQSVFNQGFANITDSLIKPWMNFNSRLSKTASTLPELFAAKG